MNLLPAGWGLEFDPSLQRFRHGTVLAGGYPGRLLTVTPVGATIVARLAAGIVDGTEARALAGRLVAAGMAHPRPPVHRVDRPPVSVIVPAYGRPDLLDSCLASLVRGCRPDDEIVVVDDAGPRPEAIADVCATHRVRLIHRSLNGGPGAARSTGMEATSHPLIAFVDSDVSVPVGWLDALAWLFDDPAMAAAAPRITPVAHRGDPAASSVRERFLAVRSPLDRGDREGWVGPDHQVRYVPTAALVVRRDAVEEVGGFAAHLRYGEDVDLIWRLATAGHRIRYVPSVVVHHVEPDRWSSILARRYHYGTSAGPLAARHPGALAPVEVRPLPTLAAAAALAGLPVVATGTVVVSGLGVARSVRPAGVPTGPAVKWAARSAGWTLVGLSRAVWLVGAPPVLLALALMGRRGRRAALVLGTLGPVVEWHTRHPALDPVRYTAACWADDLAYGVGVWRGCLTARTLGPFLPRRVRTRH